MEFRWIAAITLWTMLSGPVLIHWSTAIPRPHPATLQPVIIEDRPQLPPAVEIDDDFLDPLPVVFSNDLLTR